MGANEKVNILLVDDQPARLLTYQSVLSELGQNLVCARSGVEALDKLMREEFAVVLLDVSMPEMDGFEAAQLIHEHPRFEKTPIIFVTGVHVTDLDRLKGYKVGAVDYVSIPVVPEILRSKVAVLVELYCKRREMRELNRSLAQANERLAEANTTLQAEKTRELKDFNATLRRANTELERANRSLQSEVAERARAEQALKEADRHKDEFLAMLAHELRNPLAPILNAVQLMRAPQLPATQLTWAREVIERQLGHLTKLVDDLLDGIDLLGYLHRAEFRADAGAYAAADHQAGHNGAGFMDDREHDGCGKHGLGPELNQAASGLQSENGANGGAR